MTVSAETAVTGGDRIVVGFARALRAAGVAVPVGSVVVFAQGLARVGIDDRNRVYSVGRATLVHRSEDLPGVRPRVRVLLAGPADVPGPDRTTAHLGDPPHRRRGGVGARRLFFGRPESDVQALRYSSVEVLAQRDMSALTAAEWAEAERLISSLRIASEVKPSRRTRPVKRRTGGHPDLRGTVRRSLPSGGVPLKRSWRAPVDRARRMVFLLDVSGSMEPYARGLARFAHAAVSSRRAGRVEVFTIGTRLTRITARWPGGTPTPLSPGPPQR